MPILQIFVTYVRHSPDYFAKIVKPVRSDSSLPAEVDKTVSGENEIGFFDDKAIGNPVADNDRFFRVSLKLREKSRLAVAAAVGAALRKVGKRDMHFVAAKRQAIGEKFDGIRDADAGAESALQNPADPIIETITQNVKRVTISRAKLGKLGKERIYRNGIDEVIQLVYPDGNKRHLLLKHLSCGHFSRQPFVLDLAPKRIRKPLQDRIRNVYLGNGAIKIAKDRKLHNQQKLKVKSET